MIVINLHNSAFDNTGELRSRELGMLKDYLEREYRNGSYIIVGGDWNMNPREIQHVIKSLRGAFYRRREFEYRPQKLFLVSKDYPQSPLEKWNAEQFPTLQAAYDAAAAVKKDPFVFVLPDAKNTLPLIQYDFED